jgi:diguanylate cyclase (GGDEF)-like protein
MAFPVLLLGPGPGDLATSPWGPFEVTSCADLDAAAAALRERHHDALWVSFDGEAEARRLLDWPQLSHAVLDAAVVVSIAQPSPSLALVLLARGVQDVVPHDAAGGAPVARTLRLALERKALERAAIRAYATDLATGLPNHAQLLEHMTHLLALREREPAPMALLVLRVEGLATVASRLGVEAANVLRRKAAVRLRAGLRASDVVAAIGADTFAVLLAWIDEPGAALRVGDKLSHALRQPFSVAGSDATLAVGLGVALYPDHGRDADTLLRRAAGQAAGVAALGREGYAHRVERGPVQAANDALPPG